MSGVMADDGYNLVNGDAITLEADKYITNTIETAGRYTSILASGESSINTGNYTLYANSSGNHDRNYIFGAETEGTNFTFTGNLNGTAVATGSTQINSLRSSKKNSLSVFDGNINVSATSENGTNLGIGMWNSGTMTFQGDLTDISTLVTGNGYYNYALQNHNSGGAIVNLNAAQTNLTSEGGQWAEAMAVHQGSVYLNGNANIIAKNGTSGTRAINVECDAGNPYPSIVSLKGNNVDITASSSSSAAIGLFSSGTPGVITSEVKNLVVNSTSENKYAYGIDSQYGGNINIAEDTNTTVNATAATGAIGVISMMGWGVPGHLTSHGNLTVNATGGNYGYGISAQNDSSLIIDQITATGTSTGDDGRGIGALILNSSDVIIGADGKTSSLKGIAKNGDGFGFYMADSEENPSSATLKGTMTVEGTSIGMLIYGGTLTNEADLTVKGGIYNAGTFLNSGKLTINENNTGDDDGGAIYNEFESIFTFGNDSSALFKENTAANGGAVYNAGEMTINSAEFKDNTASVLGGAIYNEGELTIKNSKFTGNTDSTGNNDIYNTFASLTFLGENTLNGGISGELGTTTIGDGENNSSVKLSDTAVIDQNDLKILFKGTLSANADNIKVLSSVKNDGTLELTGGKINFNVVKGSEGGIISINTDNSVKAASTVSITDNNIQLMKGLFDVTELADETGSVDLSTFAKIIADNGILSFKDNKTGNITLGNIDTSYSSLKLALDADLSQLKSDAIQNASLTGDNGISISSFNIISDPSEVGFTLKIADSSIADKINMSSMTITSEDGLSKSIGNLLLTYDNNGNLIGGYTDLEGAIKSSVVQKAYSLAANETLSSAITLNGNSLSITGNSKTITGSSNEGIKTTGSQTLSIADAVISGFSTAINNDVNSVINLNNVTMSGNSTDINNSGTLNLTDSILDTVTGNGVLIVKSGASSINNITQNSLSINSGAQLTTGIISITDNTVKNDGVLNLNGSVNLAGLSGEGAANILSGISAIDKINQNDLSINSGAELTTNSLSIANNNITNNGTLYLSAGENSNTITGNGTTVIINDFQNNALIATALNINADKIFTSLASNVTGAVTLAENTVFNVTCASSSVLSGSIIVGDNATINLQNGSKDAIQGAITKASGNIKIDWLDTIKSVDEGTLTITSVDMKDVNIGDSYQFVTDSGFDKVLMGEDTELLNKSETIKAVVFRNENTENEKAGYFYVRGNDETHSYALGGTGKSAVSDAGESAAITPYEMISDEIAGLSTSEANTLLGNLQVEGNGNSIVDSGLIIGDGTKPVELILNDVNLSNINVNGENGAMVVKEKSKLRLIAQTKNIDISGTKGASKNAIYLEGSDTDNSEVEIGAKNGHTMMISDDIISQHKGNKVYFTGDRTGRILFNGFFDPAIAVLSGTTMVRGGYDNGIDWTIQNGGTLQYTNDAYLNDGTNSITFDGGTLNTVNGTATTFNLTGVDVTANGGIMYADMDFAAGKMDSFGSSPATTAAGTLNIAGLNFVNLKDTQTGTKTINFTNDPMLKAIVAYTGQKSIISPIYNYGIGYDANSGNFTITREWNPAVLTSSIATQIGYLTQLESYNQAFMNMDMYMLMPKAERQVMKMRNKYASTSNILAFSDDKDQIEKVSGWFNPYTTFESVRLKNAPDVSNVMYGTYGGVDSGLFELENGWDAIWGLYGGYNGSHQAYQGISMYENGGTLGVNGMLYKDNFFTGVTANVSGNVGQASTLFGHEDFNMLMTGIASKSGYNFELADGKFIIQPNFLAAYSFVNTFDYHNAAGIKINTDPLNAITLEPGIKLVGNLNNGYQPYAGVSVVWNILDKTDLKANDVALPELSVKPYAKYGVGLRKSWGERFTGFIQAFFTSGGRNGVGFQLGLRWALGKEEPKSHTKKSSNELPKREKTNYRINNVK